MTKRAEKPRLGRPSLGDAGRTVVRSLKVSVNELAAWQRAADEAEHSLSEWIRARCNALCPEIK